MSLWKRFCKRRWSPWVCGAVMGAVSVAYLLLLDDRMGASGGFETIDSLILGALGLAGDSFYFAYVKPAVVDSGLLIYVGMVAGAFAAAKTGGDFKARMIPDGEWAEQFGASRAKRWVAVFAGCVLLELGAGIAGGCTSGLGVSGIMRLAPAGVVFFAGAFAAGIAATIVLYRGRYRS